MTMNLLELPEYSPYISLDFDPQKHSLLSLNESGSKESNSNHVSTVLAKLSFHLDHLNKQIESDVSSHFDVLLGKVKELASIDPKISNLQSEYSKVATRLVSVKEKLHDEYNELDRQVTELRYLHEGASLVARITEFLTTYKLLSELIYENKREQSLEIRLEMATLISSMESNVKIHQLSAVTILSSPISHISSLKQKLLDVALKEVYNEPEINAQTWTLIGLLSDRLQIENTLLQQSCRASVLRFKGIFAEKNEVLELISQWMDGFSLSLKKMGSVSQRSEHEFVKIVSSKIDLELNSQKNTAVFSLMVQCYPALSSMVNEWNAQFAAFQSHRLSLMNAFKSVENAYLAQMKEKIVDAFEKYSSKPVKEDLEALFQAVSSDLKQFKKQNGIAETIVRTLTKQILSFAVKSQNKIVLDTAAFQATSPASALFTDNLGIVNSSWLMQDQVWPVVQNVAAVHRAALVDAVKECTKNVLAIVEPLVSLVYADCHGILAKMHSQLTKSKASKETGPNQYILDISSKLRLVQREIVSKLQCGDDKKQWTRQLCQKLISVFLRHGSLLRLESEAMKLKFASDMTQFEFTLNQLLNSVGLKLDSIAVESTALKMFKPFLFVELHQIAAFQGLPSLIVVHHLMSRCSKMEMPFLIRKCSEQAYIEWIDEMSSVNEDPKMNSDSHSESDQNKSQSNSSMEEPIPKILSALGQSLQKYVDDMERIGQTEFPKEFLLIQEIFDRQPFTL